MRELHSSKYTPEFGKSCYPSINRVPQDWQNKASDVWPRPHFGHLRGKSLRRGPPQAMQVSSDGSLAVPQNSQTLGFCGAPFSPANERVNAHMSLMASQMCGAMFSSLISPMTSGIIASREIGLDAALSMSSLASRLYPTNCGRDSSSPIPRRLYPLCGL